MKTLLTTAAAISLIAAVAPALAQAPAKPARPMADKVITRAEMTQSVQQQFARLDSNKDGFVVKAEAEAADKAMIQHAENRFDKRGDAMFGKFDSNKDGKVTKAEAEAAFAAVKAKVDEELDEVVVAQQSGDAAALHEEIGDLLFAVTNLARHAGVDAEAALRDANYKFTRRFHYVEARCREDGIAPADAGLARLDGYWNEVRAADKGGATG